MGKVRVESGPTGAAGSGLAVEPGHRAGVEGGCGGEAVHRAVLAGEPGGFAFRLLGALANLLVKSGHVSAPGLLGWVAGGGEGNCHPGPGRPGPPGSWMAAFSCESKGFSA